MSIYNKECAVCNEKFIPYDMLQCFNNKLYHHDCVTLYPIRYFAMLNDEPLGETEYNNGEDAYDYLEFTDDKWIY